MDTAGITRGGDVRVGELDSLTEIKEGEGKKSSLHIFQVLTRQEHYYSRKSNAQTKIMHNQQGSRRMRLSIHDRSHIGSGI
jgi:hypothetical protein